MFENVLDTEGMCTSDHFTLQENPEIDTFNMQVKLSYVDMDQDIIDGKRDLEFECGYFKNPIYQRIQSGFQITHLDNEPDRKAIET